MIVEIYSTRRKTRNFQNSVENHFGSWIFVVEIFVFYEKKMEFLSCIMDGMINNIQWNMIYMDFSIISITFRSVNQNFVLYIDF